MRKEVKQVVERLRAGDLCDVELAPKAADIITQQEAEIAALIEAGDRLNELACHQDDCQIVTHGVWSDPIPCTCGYTEAWKKWKEVRGE